MALRNDTNKLHQFFSRFSQKGREPDSRLGAFLSFTLPVISSLFCFVLAAGLIWHVIDMFNQDRLASKMTVDFWAEEELTIQEGVTEELVLKDDSPTKEPALEKISYSQYDLKEQVPYADTFIRIEGTEISYPVMWSEEEGYYLNHAPDDSINRNGSIYLSSLNQPDFSDPINYIFGHNMTSGLMFRGLNNYLESGYLEDHKDCYIVTPSETRHYTLFFAESVSSDATFRVFSRDYVGRTEYTDFIHGIANRSGVFLADDAELVMLITCTTRNRSNRTVVYGYLD